VDFALFILVTAIMFIRPLDLLPGLETIPLYLIAIVPCILVSWPKILAQLSVASLRRNPVFVFGLGILLLSVATNVAHRQFQLAFDYAVILAKILTYLVLMAAHVDSPSRLRLFVCCLVGIILIPIILAMGQYHGYVNIAALSAMEFDLKINPATGQEVKTIRFGTTGNFGDPNDVCEIVNCALIFSLYFLLDRGGGCTRVFWLAPLGVFGHALALTHSRGGFLAAVVGLMVLFWSRFRGTKSLVLGGVTLALMFVLFAGRQTSLDTSEGTAQGRIQLWDTGFGFMMRSPVSPLIGLGVGGFRDNVGHEAHNAFMATYAELGFVGGTLLFGQYFWCLANLAKLGSRTVALPDIEMRRFQPFMLAALAAFTTSEMSLTNPVAPVTYTMFGLATVFIRLADPIPPPPDVQLSQRLVWRIIGFSALFLLTLFVFVKLMVRY